MGYITHKIAGRMENIYFEVTEEANGLDKGDGFRDHESNDEKAELHEQHPRTTDF
jgi:hypothetical protein